MLNTIFQSKRTLFVVCHCLYIFNAINKSDASNTFIVSFQSDGSWSTDQWMRYNPKIVNVKKEFTVCHWEKLRYFSTSINSVWAYCYITSDSDTKLKCWQLYHYTNFNSVGRNIDLVGQSLDLEVIAEAVPFRHRQWNHFCFAYSSNKKVGKLYYNGELIKQVSEGNFTDIESGESVLQSSFIIAQEPDIFEGGYDPAQLFNGEISELNMWNKVIDDTEIKSLATCSKLVRGDVIAWEKE